ncbi:DUF2309 domain-containing protein [Oxalobacteraceae bacterium OM1]|nr:DUF2309 domain-containing protein [Oxalobacteraceae bacterium OM1]
MKAADAFLDANESALDAAIDAACSSVAPSWPLDQFIAVNPYWGWIDRPIEEADRALRHLCGTQLCMPRSFYRQAWARGDFDRAALEQALTERDADAGVDRFIAALAGNAPGPVRLPLLSDVLDAERDLRHATAWSATITHQVSQFCAAWFDRDQADWRPQPGASLYAGWRAAVMHDHGIAMLMGAPEVLARVAALPAEPRAALRQALEQLAVPPERLQEWLSAVLLQIGGWAAWCAYLRWQARLQQADDACIVELLAVRASWECLLDDGRRDAQSAWSRWQSAWARTPAAQAGDWHYQRAMEIAYQRKLAAALGGTRRANPGTPAVQAVFCIDVRSEVLRRALEQTAPDIHTRGFAGFFGLPISYTPLGTQATRSQLPSLLPPAMHAGDSSGDPDMDRMIATHRAQRLAVRAARRPFLRVPGAAFTLVESLGLGYAGKLLRRSLPGTRHADARDGLRAAEAFRLRPRLAGVAPEQQVELAARVLKAMGLTNDFARIVLLAGHGSRTANNPHASGLDCGACCGQTGEVNARALALMLNDLAVRAGLHEQGIAVPATTHFLAALHNTTTDDVELFDTDLVPASHIEDVARLRAALVAAGSLARAERSSKLGLQALAGNPDTLLQAMRKRACDWAQTRPEWGLAGNAAFIVAPRVRSRGADLEGRAFLHDYDWRADTDGSVLELIMTAPMVVTHWINMQYYASTVDNRRYGSGNKILHNVVGGRIGVFEGNGGDLRIGLPLQSLHDGETWMHAPLRLSVFIEAPRAMIERVLDAHATVRHLVRHGWLHLLRIDTESGVVEACSTSEGRWRWRALDAVAAHDLATQ